MWNRKVCGARVENDAWDDCWNCSTNRNEFDPNAVSDPVERIADTEEVELKCLRCGELVEYSGSVSFHEGTNFGVLVVFGEMFVGRKGFDLLVCSGCGKVEFYLKGMGKLLHKQAGGEDT